MSCKLKNNLIILGITLLVSGISIFVVLDNDKPFKLGLDLQGGAHLVYQANLEPIEGKDISIDKAMDSARRLIERRVNAFGVSEPLVQREDVGDKHRIIVELPGVTNIDEAKGMIGQTPFMEFRELPEGVSLTGQTGSVTVSTSTNSNSTSSTTTDSGTSTIDQLSNPRLIEFFQKSVPTDLTGANVKGSQLTFDPTTNEPVVEINFNSQGRELFSNITERNLGRPVGIFIDGKPVSVPTVQSVISSGNAIITGDFSREEAQNLAQRLNE